MKIKLALEWFINPDHLPFIVGLDKELYKKSNIELEIIEPKDHYDGFSELSKNTIQFATNEPLHLIEKFHHSIKSVGNFFETEGGVIFTENGYKKLIKGDEIKITSPVSNPVTDKIANDIIKRHLKRLSLKNEKIKIIANDFYHIKHLKKGFDAAWLCFENFEGVEAELEKVKIRRLYLKDVEIPNFCALDLFSSDLFIKKNINLINDFKKLTENSIKIFTHDLEYSKKVFYSYTKQEKSHLMDSIIENTLKRFKSPFDESKTKWNDLHNYVTKKEISKISKEEYNSMFL